jgi:hypothetical protein
MVNRSLQLLSRAVTGITSAGRQLADDHVPVGNAWSNCGQLLLDLACISLGIGVEQDHKWPAREMPSE